QAEDGIRDRNVTGVQTCALPICRTDTARLNGEAPISRATPIIDRSTVDGIDSMLSDMLTSDTTADARIDLRKYYFGDGERGTSTMLFTEAVPKLIAERSSAMEKFHFESSNAESDDE